MPSGVKAATINFDRAGKDFRNRVGLYDPKQDKVYVHSKLPRHNQGTQRSVLEHELAHRRISKAGIKLPQRSEERLATLLGALATPEEYQSHEEVALKNVFSKGLKWRNVKDRWLLVEKAGYTLNLVLSYEQVEALVK